MPEGSEGLPEGSDGLPVGAVGLPLGSKGLPERPKACQRGLRACQRQLRACQKGLRACWKGPRACWFLRGPARGGLLDGRMYVQTERHTDEFLSLLPKNDNGCSLKQSMELSLDIDGR